MSKKLMKAVLAELQALRAQIEVSQGVSIPTQTQTKQALSTDTGASFFRYIRPVDNYGDVVSQEGVTLKIDFDYPKRMLNFSYAICNHKKGQPSFCKVTGKNMARERNQYSIPLWRKPGSLDDTDVTAFIVSAIFNKKVNIPAGDRRLIIDQFERSCSNFWIDEE